MRMAAVIAMFVVGMMMPVIMGMGMSHCMRVGFRMSGVGVSVGVRLRPAVIVMEIIVAVSMAVAMGMSGCMRHCQLRSGRCQ